MKPAPDAPYRQQAAPSRTSLPSRCRAFSQFTEEDYHLPFVDLSPVTATVTPPAAQTAATARTGRRSSTSGHHQADDRCRRQRALTMNANKTPTSTGPPCSAAIVGSTAAVAVSLPAAATTAMTGAFPPGLPASSRLLPPAAPLPAAGSRVPDPAPLTGAPADRSVPPPLTATSGRHHTAGLFSTTGAMPPLPEPSPAVSSSSSSSSSSTSSTLESDGSLQGPPKGGSQQSPTTTTPTPDTTAAAATPAMTPTTPTPHRPQQQQQHCLQTNAMPWKKRPIRPASINFHSIADLVRQVDSHTNSHTNSEAAVKSLQQQHLQQQHLQQQQQQVTFSSRQHLPHHHHHRSHHLHPHEDLRLPTPPAGLPRLPPLPLPVSSLEKVVHSGDEDVDVVETTNGRLSPERLSVHYVKQASSTSLADRLRISPPGGGDSGGGGAAREDGLECDRRPASDSRETADRGSPSDPGAGRPGSGTPGGSGPSPGGGSHDPETADPNRLRKGRTIYKAQQVYVLEQVFSRTHYPDPEVIETLSRELDISENKIKVWFQNKRARWRRRAAETGLPPQPIGFTLTGTPPGLTPSWPPPPPPPGHQTSLQAGVFVPQPIYSSPYAPAAGGSGGGAGAGGGPSAVGGPRVPGAFPTAAAAAAAAAVGAFPGLAAAPSVYLGFDSSLLHPVAAKGFSGPSMLPYSAYPMPLLPTHVWGEAAKLPGT